MKIKFITIIIASILGFLTNDLIAQTKVEANSIAIMKYNDHTQGLLLGDPIVKANSIFGNPTSTSTEYNEMEEKQMTLYKYGTNTILYFMDGVLLGFELAISTPFTVGKINGPTLTTSSSSITASLGWSLEVTKQNMINIQTPEPGGGGGDPYQTEYFLSGDVFINNVNTDNYFQVRYIQNGVVKSVMVGSR